MRVRTPSVAGQFYPSEREGCRAEARQMLASSVPPRNPVAGRVVGGMVPHAGWICSGAVAGHVVSMLAQHDPAPETVVIFGAVHRRSPHAAMVDVREAWESPLASMPIDEEMAEHVLKECGDIMEDSNAHDPEHSIEVQVPLVQAALPDARLLPIMVMPSRIAPEIGRCVAQCAQTLHRKVAFLGSSDLTHYGPRYGFTPQGAGEAGLRWAKEVNDRRFLERVLDLDAEGVLREAAAHHNACGSGAVAATIEACRVYGADRAELLEHTTSSEVLAERYGRMDDAVGYAGVIFLAD